MECDKKNKHARTVKDYHKNKEKRKDKLKKIKKEYDISLNGKYNSYKNSANSRSLIFNLTREDFNLYWQESCWYCKREILTIGLDRVDNSKGYTLDNIVSCCESCNRAKLAQTVEEFLLMCKLIYENHNLQNIKTVSLYK